MALALSLGLGAAALSGCVAPQARVAPAAGGPLRVMPEGGGAYANWDGAAARRQADAICAARGQRLRPSIYDRFEAGAWVYVEGCA